MATIAPALLLVAALRSGSVLAERPGSAAVARRLRPTADGKAVAHVCTTGRLLPVCGARTRRLAQLPDGVAVLGSDRRVCRRCTARLAGGAPVTTTRAEMDAAFGNLTVEDLAAIAGWARSVEESHQIGRVLMMRFGCAPRNPTTAEGKALRAVELDLYRHRRKLESAERSPEERARIVAQREAEQYDRDVIRAARIQQDRVDIAVARRAQDRYLPTWERELLPTA
ncbi:hypothetical protein [Nocardioides sp.]|uniref:hypothetical protein n=1 Tax=Nocardioides sp. TaxID=35761 RepID=UPI0026024BB7|nr:hypothetical protein [Nocardioides sp.]